MYTDARKSTVQRVERVQYWVQLIRQSEQQSKYITKRTRAQKYPETVPLAEFINQINLNFLASLPWLIEI